MDSTSGEPLAKIAQRRLRKNAIDFASMTTEEGLNEIIKLLQEESNDQRKDALLQKGTRLEVAMVKQNRGSHTRKTIASLVLNRQ